MKHFYGIRTLVCFVVLATCSTVKAQPYFFTQSTATYSNLVSPTSINNGSVWSSFQSFTVPIGFTFNFMGNNYTNIYIEGSGFCRFDAAYYYLINPFTVQMEDKGTSSSLSPLSYTVTGVAPNRILKIEWNNCGFAFDVAGTANFQLWLYETSHIIETHIGTCTASASAYNGNAFPGPAMGIYEFTSGTFCSYGIGLTGVPTAASANLIQNATTDIFDYSLSGTPTTNAVYRFTPGTVDVKERDEEIELSVFPNPANNIVTVSLPNNTSGTMELISSSGQIVYSSSSFQKSIQVNADAFIPGLYLVRFTAEDNSTITTKKLIIE